MNIQVAMKLFNTFMIVHNLDDGTIQGYTYWVNRFFDFLEISDTSEISDISHIEFIQYLMTENYAPSTINVAVCAVQYFYEVVLNKILTHRQFPRFKYANDNEVRIFTQEEVHLLISKSGLREKCIIGLGVDAGLRASEVACLKIEDLSSQNMTVQIRKSKRNKSRTVPLSPWLCRTLTAYCKFNLKGSHSGYLFPGRCEDGHLSPQTISSNFKKKVRKELGEKDDRHFHCLRHTYATAILKAGNDLFMLKRLLGHKSLHSTVRYVHYYDDDLNQVRLPSTMWKWR